MKLQFYLLIIFKVYGVLMYRSLFVLGEEENNFEEHQIINENVKDDSLLYETNLEIPKNLNEDADQGSSDISNLEITENFVEDQKENNTLDNDIIESLSEANNTNNSTTTKKSACIEIGREDQIGNVEIINGSYLLTLLQSEVNITSTSTPALCYLVYFFSPYCPFSIQGSAYVNALARSVPNIPIYGLDSIEHHSVNARYGVIGTPSLFLFHNGQVTGRYNASEYATSQLEAFLAHFTDQLVMTINVTSEDFKADLPTQLVSVPLYTLYAAWIFLVTCAGYVFLNSEWFTFFSETVLNNWREAEAQHEHDD